MEIAETTKTKFYNNDFCKQCVKEKGEKDIRENHLCIRCKKYEVKK